jgi:hypothetical protein
MLRNKANDGLGEMDVEVRKPRRDLPDDVKRNIGLTSDGVTMGPCRLDSPICLVALSGQAPQPRSGAPKARGLRANARTERRFLQGDARLCRTMSVESSTSLYK